MNEKEKKLNATPILFAVFLIAICGIVYELIVGAISSYLLGDSVKQYSITIGLYMSAMGVGSALSKRVEKNLFDKFVTIELMLGIVGGCSGFILLASFAYTQIYHLMMYTCVMIIGILVGLEIPILTRIMESYRSDLKTTLANVMSFDYIGGLLGSLAFPLVLLPHLGHMKSSFLVGIINVVVAFMLIYHYKEKIKYYKVIRNSAVAVLLLLILGFLGGDALAKELEDNLYRDRVIYSQQTKYQKIITTKYKEDMRLFLDGNLQFSSKDEYRYHEALVHPAMSLAPHKARILLLGAGDGLALREVLKYEEVEEVVLVELDPEMIRYCATDASIKELNEGSLESDKVTVKIQDAYHFLEENSNPFDVIIIDLPDPNNETLNKLYTNIFYRLVGQNLDEEGIAVVQSTSPLQANKAFWCIQQTIASEGFWVDAYGVEVPSFGNWGFSLFAKKEYDPNEITVKVATKFLEDGVAQGLFEMGKDQQAPKGIKINTLNHPKLLDYYLEASYQ